MSKKWEKKKEKIEMMHQYPVSAVFIMTIASILIMIFNNIPTILLAQLFQISMDSWFVYFIYEILLLIYSLLFLMVKRKFNILKSGRGKNYKSLLACLLMMIEILYILVINIKTIRLQGLHPIQQKEILYFVIYLLLVAITEETVFRGIFHYIFQQKWNQRGYILWGTILNGVCFGGMHIINIVNQGMSFYAVMLQAINSIIIGMYYFAIFLLSESIWCGILLHFFYDFAQLLVKVIYADMSLSSVFSQYNDKHDWSYLAFHGLIYVLGTIIILCVVKRGNKSLKNKKK